MSDIAFFAPLKSPDHPTPSGDREMARSLMTAISAGLRAPGRVRLVSDLRLREPRGNAADQATLRDAAARETERLTTAFAGQDIGLWVTYHNYYKAPDLLGPPVCAALNLPYVIIEASRAKSRLIGPWAGFATAAEAASDAADLIFHLTALDGDALRRDRPPGQRLTHLRPFLPRDTLPAAGGTPTGPMLAVAMMRRGDKLASYRIIAETLAAMPHENWRLDIAGDGPARTEVEALMRPFGPRVRLLGQLDRDGLAAAYARAALLLWPGVNEAYGMVYLEAQAAGLPVVAQDRPGVRDVLCGEGAPSPDAGAPALATMAARLLTDPALRQRQGDAARRMIARFHLRPTATNTFWDAAAPLMKGPQP